MLKPPEGYASWIEYAIATMDTRSLYLESCDDDSPWGRVIQRQREEVRGAAREELAALKARAKPDRDLVEGYVYYRTNDIVKDAVSGLRLNGSPTSYDEEIAGLVRALAERMTNEELAAYLKDKEDVN